MDHDHDEAPPAVRSDQPPAIEESTTPQALLGTPGSPV